MKTLLRFFGDPRNADQRKRYTMIEQRRADAYLGMYVSRKRAAILRGQINTPIFTRRQAE